MDPGTRSILLCDPLGGQKVLVYLQPPPPPPPPQALGRMFVPVMCLGSESLCGFTGPLRDNGLLPAEEHTRPDPRPGAGHAPFPLFRPPWTRTSAALVILLLCGEMMKNDDEDAPLDTLSRQKGLGHADVLVGDTSKINQDK